MSDKIIRTICLFKQNIEGDEQARLEQLENQLVSHDYSVQTKRICSPAQFGELEKQIKDLGIMLSVGTRDFVQAADDLATFYTSRDNFNVELGQTEITHKHTQLLFDIIQHAPSKTFNFTYVFNNAPSSPYMPSASYAQNGFALGLQPTDLAKDCKSLDEWLERLEQVYQELADLLAGEPDFLGIDSSVAPLFEDSSSLVNFIKQVDPLGFSHSITTPIYTQISNFIKSSNPKPIGLCGLMLPCLEDFELAREYEQGNFSIERNIFVSLHSGLGIDTYPIGVDEKPERVLEILQLIQALANKYSKPLSVRFVSDGHAKIGDKTDFGNQYLYDVVVRGL